MVAEIIVYFSHIEETLSHCIEKATGHKPKLTLKGDNFSNGKPVYLCEFDTTKSEDDKILKGFKKLNIKVGQVTSSPPDLKQDHVTLRH